MGISKRGNQHLRSLLVHGARAVVRTAPRKTDLNNQWVNQLRERRGFNRATETTNTQRFEADSLAARQSAANQSARKIPLNRTAIVSSIMLSITASLRRAGKGVRRVIGNAPMRSPGR
jgi:hypothetical protein